GLFLCVVDTHTRSARHFDALWCELIESARLRPRKEAVQCRHEIDAAQVVGRADPGQVRSEPRVETRGERLVAQLGPRGAEGAVQEVQSRTQGGGRVAPREQSETLALQRAADRAGD